MIVFTDRHNFHTQNFPALFRALQLDRVRSVFYDHDDANLKRAGGDYAYFAETLADALAEVRALPLASLFELRREGVRLWDVCRFELLQYVMLDRRFYGECRPNDPEELFHALARHRPDDVRLNFAAAIYWVDYWFSHVYPRRRQRATVAMFGNSLIYTRALALQAEQLNVTPLVFEHFFTGHDHFMEPRLDPIQGYADLRLGGGVEPDLALVYGRLAAMQNKNVRQAPYRRPPRARGGSARRVLVLGQVVNDFAAITPGNRVLGTVGRYQRLLDALMAASQCEVVFKAHPYEHHKTRGKGRVTYDQLRYHAARRGFDSSRFRLVDDEPLGALLDDTDLVVTLHSQGGLEAIAAGVPVATLGNPFYGRQGFTHDFDEVEPLVEAVASDAIEDVTDAQLDRFHRFMTLAFRRLVNRYEPRDAMLERLARVGVYPEDGPPRSKGPKPKPGRAERAMRKTRKLLRDPALFFADALMNIRGSKP